MEGQLKPENEAREAVKHGKSPRGQRMREQALDAMNEETVTGLEQVFEAKLSAVRVYEQRLSCLNEPYARDVLTKLIQEERAQLLYLADLIDMVEQTPEMGRLARTQRRISHQLRSPAGKNVTLGLGAAVLAYFLLPSVKKVLHPVAVKAVQGVMELSEQAQGLFANVREDIEDLVSEAEFENFKSSLDIPEEVDAMTGSQGPELTDK